MLMLCRLNLLWVYPAAFVTAMAEVVHAWVIQTVYIDMYTDFSSLPPMLTWCRLVYCQVCLDCCHMGHVWPEAYHTWLQGHSA